MLTCITAFGAISKAQNSSSLISLQKCMGMNLPSSFLTLHQSESGIERPYYGVANLVEMTALEENNITVKRIIVPCKYNPLYL